MISPNDSTNQGPGRVIPALVTPGETLRVLQSEHIGPFRHNRSVRLGVVGAETNVAIGVRRLGVPSAWIGRVGDDPMGELVARELRAEGVDVTSRRMGAGAPTGIVVKERRTAKVSRVFYARSGSAGSRLCPDDVNHKLVEGTRVLHVTGITPALSESARAAVHHAIDLARNAGVLVSFDLNYRMGLWAAEQATDEFRSLVTLSDVVFASHDDAQILVGDLDAAGCAADLSELGPKHVVIKEGELGYTALIEGPTYTVPAVVVPVVEPRRCWRCLRFRFMVSLIRGEPPEVALQVANTSSAFEVSAPGGWEGLPSAAQLTLLDSLVDVALC